MREIHPAVQALVFRIDAEIADAEKRMSQSSCDYWDAEEQLTNALKRRAFLVTPPCEEEVTNVSQR